MLKKRCECVWQKEIVYLRWSELGLDLIIYTCEQKKAEGGNFKLVRNNEKRERKYEKLEKTKIFIFRFIFSILIFGLFYYCYFLS